LVGSSGIIEGIVKLLLLASAALLIACYVGSDNHEQTLRFEKMPTLTDSVDPQSSSDAPAQLAKQAGQNLVFDSVPDDSGLRYYPLSKYLKYPKDVRSLIRWADMENGRCRGRFDNETYRACSRCDAIMFELKKKGWCWGGSDVSYLEHWLRCVDDPYYHPDEQEYSSPYSEE
jgi:hypothetical protein